MVAYACAYGDEGSRYRRMLSVLEASARRHGVTIATELFKPPEDTGKIGSNHAKFLRWASFVADTDDDVLLLDADMYIRQKIDLDIEADAYITRRTNHTLPLNGGVVFVRNNYGGKEFMRRWLSWEMEYINNRDKYKNWYKQYGGPNQTALGLLLAKDSADLDIKELDCWRWNALQEHHGDVEQAKIVHLKGRLGDFCVSDLEVRRVPLPLKQPVREWRNYESHTLND